MSDDHRAVEIEPLTLLDAVVEANTWGGQLRGVSDGRGRNLLGVLLAQRRDQKTTA